MDRWTRSTSSAALDEMDAELSLKRMADAAESVNRTLRSYPSEATELDRRNAERVLRVALDAGLDYSGNVAALARLAYAPPKLGTKVLQAAAPRGLTR